MRSSVRQPFLVFVLSCCAVLSIPSTLPAQGLLEEVREEVAEDPPAAQPPKSKRRHEDVWCDDDDSSELPPLFGYVLASPWIGPLLILEGEAAQPLEFLPAPYWRSHPGLMTLDFEHSQPFSLQVTEEFATNFDDVYRDGVRIQLDTVSRFGVDTQYNYWWEKLPAGTDHIETGDFNLVYRFAQAEAVQFHSGLGFNWLADSGVDLGFNMTYGWNWFPADPFVFSTDFDAGTLGNSGLFHVRSTVGVLYERLEVFTGIDYLRIGRGDLVGCLAGLRLWF